jgi:hypothetical protein
LEFRRKENHSLELKIQLLIKELRIEERELLRVWILNAVNPNGHKLR